MPRKTVRTTWDEVEIRKKFSFGASILFSTESEETNWREKLWTVWRPVLWLKLKILLSNAGKTKNIVVWLSTSSRVSWLQVWKQTHLWRSLPVSTCWWWEETQREVEEEGTQGAVAILKKENVQGCVSPDSDPMNSILRKVEELGLNASAAHTRKFSGCTWCKTEFGKERHLEALSQKVWTSWAKSLRAQFLRRNTWWNLTTSRLYQQSSVEFGEKNASSKPNFTTFHSLVRAPETQKIVCLLRIRELHSMHNAEQGDLSSDTMDTLKRSKPKATYRDRVQCNYTSKHQFLFMISTCSQQCNYSMKRQRFYCFMSSAQKRGYSYEWKTAKLNDWQKMGRHLLVRWTTQYFSLCQDCHHIAAAFCLQHSRDQSNFARKFRTLSEIQ